VKASFLMDIDRSGINETQLRHSAISRREPGLQLRPVAQLEDPLPPPEQAFGVVTTSHGEKDLLSQHVHRGVLEVKVAEQREKKYASALREPLGRTMVRGHTLPPEFASGEAAFGQASDKASDAKQVIFPADLYSDPARDEIYRISHHHHGAGEQTPSAYDWSAVSGDPRGPGEFRFGLTQERTVDGVAKTLDVDKNLGESTMACIVSLRQAKYKEDTHARVGSMKPIGRRDPGLPPDHVFGVSTSGRDDWGAGALLRGTYAPAEQEPDKDLGKPVVPPTAPKRDERVFGIPSVRHDIKPPKIKSIANNLNYGGEPNARAVLFPPKYGHTGLYEEDFNELLTKEELRPLITAKGMEVSQDEFEAIFETTSRNNGGSELLSVAQIRETMIKIVH
jgi:hypothetical protein